MTISSPLARAVHLTNEAVTDYAFPFKVFKDSELAVSLVGQDSVVVPLALGLDYTVSGLGLDQGGTVHLTSAGQEKAGTDLDLVLLRNMDFTQETDYRPHDIFPAETHERALDILTMICQELREMMGRAIVAPPNLDEPIQYAGLEALLTASEEALALAQEAANTAQEVVAQAVTEAVTLARQWAANPEDEEVQDELYSAFHYALQAAKSAQEAADTLAQGAPTATNDSLGLVKGVADTPGMVSVNNSGEMEVNGWESPWPLAKGGTGAETAAEARTNLGASRN